MLPIYPYTIVHGYQYSKTEVMESDMQTRQAL